MSYYDETARGYDELHSEEQLKKLRIIANNISTTESTKLLDVGCGTGLSAKIFKCNITGIDPSAGLLKQCPFKAIKASAESIPFPDKSFDAVIAVTCIHNFDDIEKGLKEMRRVGKGVFALTVLKKSQKKNLIIGLIKKQFKIKKEIDEDKDLIFICS